MRAHEVGKTFGRPCLSLRRELLLQDIGRHLGMDRQHEGGEALHFARIDHSVAHTVRVLIERDTLRTAHEHGVEQPMRIVDQRFQTNMRRIMLIRWMRFQRPPRFGADIRSSPLLPEG